MKTLLTLALAIALAASTGLSGAQQRGEEKKPVPTPTPAKQKKVNPCASMRCQSGYHCVRVSDVGICARDRAPKCTITCGDASMDMHGSCGDYADQLASPSHGYCKCYNR